MNLFDWDYCTEKSSYARVINKVFFSNPKIIKFSRNSYSQIKEAELCAGIPDMNGNGLIDGGKEKVRTSVKIKDYYEKK